MEEVYEQSGGQSELQSYLAIGSNDPEDDQLRRALAGMIGGPQAAVSGAKGSYTLPLKNSTAGDLMKTFMACQSCGEISTQSKQLQCSHTICQKCAMQMRSKHLDPGIPLFFQLQIFGQSTIPFTIVVYSLSFVSHNFDAFFIIIVFGS